MDISVSGWDRMELGRYLYGIARSGAATQDLAINHSQLLP